METSDSFLGKGLCKKHQVLMGKILLESEMPANKAGVALWVGGYVWNR